LLYCTSGGWLRRIY